LARKKRRSKSPTIVDLRAAAVAALTTWRDTMVAELATVDAGLAAANGTEVKRGPGRPPKAGRGPGRPPKNGRRKARRGPGRPPKSETVRRGPGRPKGKRGPGRPPKAATTAKRGRPPKAAPAAPAQTKAAKAPAPKDFSALDAAIRAAMTGATAPMKAGEIAKCVVEGGYQTTSGAFHLEVGRRLAVMADVAKPEPGRYVLK